MGIPGFLSLSMKPCHSVDSIRSAPEEVAHASSYVTSPYKNLHMNLLRLLTGSGLGSVSQENECRYDSSMMSDDKIFCQALLSIRPLFVSFNYPLSGTLLLRGGKKT